MTAIAWAERIVRRTIWPIVPEGLKRAVRPTIMRIRGDVVVAPTVADAELQQVCNEPPEVALIERRYAEVIEGAPRRPGDGGTNAGDALTSPASIDALVGYAHHAAVKSHDAMLRLIHSFHYRFPEPPADPHSAAYKDFWAEQYRQVAQRDYAFRNELHHFDDGADVAIYPYNTRDPKIVALHLIAAGTILDSITKPPPARVLEMGVGWGNTALQIGLCGYDVTVLDIEQKYLDIVKRRFGREGLDVNCINGEFFSAEQIDGKFDIILFYECFHHCIEHVALLAMLKRKLNPGGIILFAGETIDNTLPFAWGLNPSGQGVWSIRHHGWMELTFTERYFLDLLHRAGFEVTKNQSPHSAHSVVYTATVSAAV
ncbi:class I SAM-dependent methyltransferase [Rhodopseudomonas sp. NSM]|uniref:class I SAM-dependent methyltransferase n=1 Tax=Rhodopseudomonas sp. NSM TaxID=3457630 RepID=UPI0040362CE7